MKRPSDSDPYDFLTRPDGTEALPFVRLENAILEGATWAKYAVIYLSPQTHDLSSISELLNETVWFKISDYNDLLHTLNGGSTKFNQLTITTYKNCTQSDYIDAMCQSVNDQNTAIINIKNPFTFFNVDEGKTLIFKDVIIEGKDVIAEQCSTDQCICAPIQVSRYSVTASN